MTDWKITVGEHRRVGQAWEVGEWQTGLREGSKKVAIADWGIICT